MSAEELLLSNTALLSEETGGGRLNVSWQVVQYVPLTSTGRVQSVALADCVGASAERSELVLHCVTLHGGGCLGSPHREPSQARMPCRDGGQAERWAAAVWNIMHGVAPDAPPPRQKRWLVLINPVSGPGHARRVYARCRPLFEAHRVALTEVVTTHAGHVREIAAQIEPAEVDAVVCVGGDGVVHELVNGLFAREDADAAVSALSIGVLPGGSANSLCVSLLKANNEKSDSRRSKGGAVGEDDDSPAEGRLLHGFLSMEWAFAADLDLGLEHLRWLGSPALWLMLAQRQYAGGLRFKPKGSEAWRTLEAPFFSVWACNTRWPTTSTQLNWAHLGLVKDSALSTFVDLTSGKHAEAPFLEYVKATEIELDPQPRTAEQPGMLAIDGELVPYASTHISVLPGKLHVLGAVKGGGGDACE
ncbi:hypothetical protein EMIHUDRAFT_246668 [Emiliania huxleyi CCMP1516]|uniref:DAGKc domain-containing protein n=2 Tax=Emiliania huxleyi TaxID=2903 RepID=A0A0D3IR18_EMIH1|nr:hypothetical protein EMIHUDRAFT_246668 [Emiliania huxleyi CCMP1516]EOD13703.1 hypothetical protein EMIHUDRAFT_246668 [Emiliania huxleyi CCMP1516]|eukprot:XP_005766132.1 hypothetical protein EMIHUDRAFT_246668 [Emiliania huxleyi CCMP1516]